MKEELNIIEVLESFIALSSEFSAQRALSILSQPQIKFAVVSHEGRARAVIESSTLEQVAAQNQPLSAILSQLPSSVRVHGEVISLVALKNISSLLESTNAPGVLVYLDSQMTGVISMRSLKSAVSRLTTTVDLAASAQPNILASISAQVYVCRACNPASFSSPLEGNAAPDCEQEPVHGPMEEFHP
jgi:hypothetical protein